MIIGATINLAGDGRQETGDNSCGGFLQESIIADWQEDDIFDMPEQTLER